MRRLISQVLMIVVASQPAELIAQSIEQTPHNLSVSGPGTIRAVSETSICDFCHTPHSANVTAALWNRRASAANYSPYSSSTAVAQPGQPTGSSILSLSRAMMAKTTSTPAMNTHMWRDETTQANLAVLRDRGAIAPGRVADVGYWVEYPHYSLDASFAPSFRHHSAYINKVLDALEKAGVSKAHHALAIQVKLHQIKLAHDEHAVPVQALRQGVEPALGNRLGPPLDHLAAFEHLGEHRVPLQTLRQLVDVE